MECGKQFTQEVTKCPYCGSDKINDAKDRVNFMRKMAYETENIIIGTDPDAEGEKIYRLEGPLFFASVTSFAEQFDLKNDPDEVIIDFKDARVMDSSGVEAIDNLTDKYKKLGKKLTLRHLSSDCKKVLTTAGPFCTYEEDDPTYKVALNQ